MITDLEQRAGGVMEAYVLLGVSRNRWFKYKSGESVTPAYIEASLRAHLALSDRAFREQQRIAWELFQARKA